MGTRIVHYYCRDLVIPSRAIVLPTEHPNQKPHILIDGVEYKYCSYCEKWYVLNEYWVNNTTHDGLQQHCKECVLLLNREYIAKKRRG